MKNTTFAVGGYWHCDKCGEEYHSSRHHTCEPPVTARPDEADKPPYQVKNEAFEQCMERLGIAKNLGHASDLEPLWDAGYLRGVSECEEKYVHPLRNELAAERTRRIKAEGIVTHYADEATWGHHQSGVDGKNKRQYIAICYEGAPTGNGYDKAREYLAKYPADNAGHNSLPEAREIGQLEDPGAIPTKSGR